MKHLLVVLVRVWRAVVSPLYGDVCKYHPSCSAYGLEALRTHGAVKGSLLAAWRILRCNPFSRGGYDPVPGTEAARAWQAEQAARAAGAPPAAAATPSHNTRGEN